MHVRVSSDRTALDDLLAPTTADTFLREVLHKNVLHARGDGERFAALVPWSAVNEVTRLPFTPPYVRLVHDGRTVPPVDWCHGTRSVDRLRVAATVSHSRIAAALREGATLIINNIDDIRPNVADFLRPLERILGLRMRANAYAVWRSEAGFQAHYDDHDTFIVQVHGHKRWRVFEGLSPTQPNDPPCFDQELTAGDVLYVPRGWWHIVEPCGEPTLHLTIGFLVPTARDLMNWMFHQLEDAPQQWALWWQGVGISAATRHLTSPAAECLRVITDFLQRPELADEFAAHIYGQTTPRSGLGLPFSAVIDDQAIPAHAILVAAGSFYSIQIRGGEHVLSFDEKEIVLGERERAAVEYLLRHTPVPFDVFIDAHRSMDATQLRQFVCDLAAIGFVEVLPQ